MPRSYQEIIRLIQNGDPVDSSINTILRALAGNADYLKQLLDEALLGQAVLAREVTVHEDVKVGQPVYFNATTQQLEQALASASVGTDGQLVTDVSTQVWGICYFKHNSTKADILLYGYVELDVTEAISDTVAGMYYLSATSPGKLVRQVPPVTVPVLYWDGDSHVYVNPNFNSAFLQHQHYKFELRAVPAGDNAQVLVGAPHVILNADSDVEGWLPADHAVFNGNAPVGAKFGYNLSASALNNLWPPLPINGTTISWTRNVPAESSTIDVPSVNIAYEVFDVIDSLAAGDSTTHVLSFTDSGGFSGGDDILPFVDQATLEAAGLTVDYVEVSNTDEITIGVTNNTDTTVTYDLDIAAYVLATQAHSAVVADDFKEDTVPESLVVIDTKGIWWMSDCYGTVPWPPTYGAEETGPDVGAFLAVSTSLGVLRTTPVDALATVYGVYTGISKDVAIDFSNYDVYYTTGGLSILKASLNTTTTTPIVAFASEDEIEIIGLDLDVNGGVMYFTNAADGEIRKANMDGTDEETILTGLSSPKGIRVDVANDHLYFADGAKIRRCDVDGSNLTDIVTGLNTPRFLALDVDGNKLYWTDSGSNKVSRSTLLGASITDLVTSVDAVGIDIDVTNGKLYYSIEGTPAVFQANINGSSPASIISLQTWQVPGGLRVREIPDFGALSACGSADMQLTCWFTKMQFQSASTVVTSLRAVSGSGLTITCVQDDSVATTGDLQIDFDPDFLVDPDLTHTGHIVIKTYEDKTFKRGPVVEAIVVDSDYILASATATDGDNLQGTVTLSFTPTPVGAELPIEMVRLNNVEEEFYEEVLGLGFRQDVEAEYRAKVNIPSTIEATTVRIKLRFLMLTRAAGDLPTFTLTARNVTRPGATTATALALPTSDTSVTINTADGAGMAEDDYIEVVSAEITTAPGDFVLFTLGRDGTSDSFAGDIHVIDQRAVISSITA